MSTETLVIGGSAALVVVLAITWVLRARLGLYRQLHRWPTAEDLQAAKAERARGRAVKANVDSAKKAVTVAQRAQQGRVKAAEKQLELTTRNRSQAIASAQAEVRAAERNYEAKVRQAQKGLDLWQTPGSGSKIGTYKDVTLFQHHIRTAQGTGSTLRVKATVDTAGNLAVTRRVTFTRLIALGIVGGLLFKKKDKDDTRELYLLVETSDFASVTKCEPKDGTKVRQLAAKIATAALQEHRFRAQKPAEIVRCLRELDAARQDRVEINQAQLRLQHVESDQDLIGSIGRAQRIRDETLSDRREWEAARTRLNDVMLLAKPAK